MANRNDKPSGHTIPAESERPVISGRVHYETKLSMMKRCYERSMRPAAYIGMLIEEVERRGGWDELQKIFERSDNYEEMQKQLEGLQEALEKEKGQREQEEQKSKRLQKEKQTEAKKAKGEGTEKGKLQDQVKKLEGEVKELKSQLEEEKKKREEVEKRLEKANKWRAEKYGIFGDDPPPNGW